MPVHLPPRPRIFERVAPRLGEARSPAELAQRRAWAYIWAAFAVWLILTGAGLYTLNNWRKTSYTAPPAQLVSKRGIVLYKGPRDALPVSISERTALDEGGEIEVPASSEAVLQIGVDNSTVRLRSGSRLRLETMRVGRFNQELTQVRLDQLAGAANYSIVGELPNRREVEVTTPHARHGQDGVKLSEGEYLIWVQQTGTRLLSYDGQARAESNGAVYRLRDGRWALLGTDRDGLRQVLPLPEHLIKNRDFGRGLGESWSPIDFGEKGRPDVGGQRILVDEVLDGRRVRSLRLVRDTAKDTHNETGLSQPIDREVWAYRSVTFSAWVKVVSASLDGGGYAGSEYPLMFRINYVAENGGNYTWAHGFYVKNDSNRPTDIGEQIAADQWYTFSLDMATLAHRPAYISNIEVLASGHDYDAQVANIELTVE